MKSPGPRPALLHALHVSSPVARKYSCNQEPSPGAAGVKHNDISILASNADNWYSKDSKYPTRRRARQRTNENDRARVQALMDKSSVNPNNRAAMYRKDGWQRFDPAAPTYNADQVRRERELYRS